MISQPRDWCSGASTAPRSERSDAPWKDSKSGHGDMPGRESPELQKESYRNQKTSGLRKLHKSGKKDKTSNSNLFTFTA